MPRLSWTRFSLPGWLSEFTLTGFTLYTLRRYSMMSRLPRCGAVLNVTFFFGSARSQTHRDSVPHLADGGHVVAVLRDHQIVAGKQLASISSSGGPVTGSR